MSFFDPHHVYDKKKRKSHKGQIIQKRLGTNLIPPMSNEELARMKHYLISNGILTEDRQYSLTLHKVYSEQNFPLPRGNYSILHFQPIYNYLFKDNFQWKVPPTGTQQPKSFEVMLGVTRIEYLYKTEIGDTSSTTNSYIPNRTEVQTYTKTQCPNNRHLIYTPQDTSYCQLTAYTGTRYPNYTTVNNYSFLISYHSYDVNDYRKFALGSNLPLDELFAVGMSQYALANTGDVELEMFITINYTY